MGGNGKQPSTENQFTSAVFTGATEAQFPEGNQVAKIKSR